MNFIAELVEDVIRLRGLDYDDPCDAAWLRYALAAMVRI